MTARIDPLIVDIVTHFLRGQEEALVAQQQSEALLETLRSRGVDLASIPPPGREEILEFERDQLSAEAAVWRHTRTSWRLAFLPRVWYSVVT